MGDEAYVGKDLGRNEFEVSEEVLGHYFEGLGVDGGIYEGGGLYGRRVAPSMILTNVDGGFSGGGFEDNFGNLWIRQEWDMRLPMFAGEVYGRSSRVVDVYKWRERTVVKQEVCLWSGGGELMARGLHHQSYLLGRSDMGMVKLRDPKSKEGVRRFVVPDGEAVGGVERDISLEMCGVFFHGNRNYHTDRGAAEELGFEEVVVGGRMTMSYIGDMMDRRFGRGWFEGGRLDIKFTNIVWPEDRVVARGVVTDRVDEGDGVRASVAVWMEKLDGTVVIVGTASALE